MAIDEQDRLEGIHYPLWERQDFETDEQWAAFQHYRNTPAAVRTLDRTSSEMFVKRKKLQEWCKVLHWHERAVEFDRHLDRHMSESLANSQSIHEVRRAHLGLLGLFTNVLKDELECLLKQQAERRAQGAHFSILKPQELARSLRDTVVLSRLLMGESTENLSVGKSDLTNLTDEELEILEKVHDKKDASLLTSGYEKKLDGDK